MEDHKSKTTALRTIMNNPKMSRMVNEAWKAPFGSTKRQQAKALLSTVNKLKQNRAQADGQGGIADFHSNVGTNYNNIMSAEYNPLTVHGSVPNAPLDSINSGKSSSSKGGKGGTETPTGIVPMIQDFSTGLYPQLQAGAAKAAVQVPLSIASGIQTGGEALSHLFYNPTPSKGLATPYAQTSAQQLYSNYIEPGIESVYGVGHTEPYNPTSPGGPNVYTNLLKGAAPATYAQALTQAADSKQPVVDPNQPTPPPEPPVWETYGGRLTDLGGDKYSYINNDGTTYVGIKGDNYQDPTLSAADRMKQLATSAPTAESFISQVQSDPTMMKYLYPGGTPQEQDLKLFNKIMDTSGLTQAQNSFAQAQAANQAITPDLVTYTRNHDTYIDGINQAVDAAKNRQFTPGGNDPNSVMMNSMYIDFLSGLKAQQSQRYADVINNAQTQLTAKLTYLQQQVTDATAKFNAELPIAKTDADAMISHLNSLYNSYSTTSNDLSALDDASLKALSERVDYMKNIQGFANAPEKTLTDAKAIIDNSMITAKTTGTPTEDYHKLPVDLSGKMQLWLASNYSPEAINAAITQTLDETFAKESGPAAIDELNNVTNSFHDLVQKGLPQEMTNKGYTGNLQGDLMTILNSRASSALKSYITTNQAAVEKALTSLPANANDAGKMADWKKSNATLNSNFLDFVAGTYSKGQQAGGAGSTKEAIFGLTKTGGFLGIGASYDPTAETDNTSRAIASWLVAQIPYQISI